jgi:tetratricopeptide (TPR) repeat protein
MAWLRRRNGDVDRAEAMFEEILVGVRAGVDPDAWQELCAACRHAHESKWSELATSEAVALFGARNDVLLERVRFLRSARRCDEAFALLAGARAEDDVGLLVEQGGLLLDTGKPDQALACFQEALRRDGRRIQALNGVGRAHEAAGHADEALTAYRAEVDANLDSSHAHNDLGTFLSDKKREFAAAAIEFRESVRLEPDFAEGFNNLGCALEDAGDLDGAAAALRSAIAVDKFWQAPHNNLGDVLLRKDDLDGAIAEFREAVRLNQDYAPSHFNLGSAMSKRDAKGAVLEFDRAVTLDAKYADAWNERGCVLEDLGDIDKALESFEHAAACAPDDPTYALNRGELLLSQRRDWRVALPLLEFAAAHASTTESDGEEHYEFGLALVFAGRLDEALLEMQLAVKLKPTGEQRRMSRWSILTALGRHAEARDAADDDLNHHPGKAEFAWRKSLSLASLGQAEDARTCAARALGAEPEPADVFDFAYLCVLAGRPDDARTWLAKGAALDGDGDAYQRACVCGALGAREDALRWIEVAAQKGYFMSSHVPVESAFDGVKNEARFQAAMEKIVVR